MRTESGTTVHRQDYKPFPFEIPEVELEFDLDPDLTWLRSRLIVRRKPQAPEVRDLALDGEDLALVSVHLNGVALVDGQYTVSTTQLIIHNLPDEAVLDVVSTSRPVKNTSLSGRYVSGSTLFTQCEAQGFRRICWFADRPDVMSTYRVTLRGDRRLFPVLLSNGNMPPASKRANLVSTACAPAAGAKYCCRSTAIRAPRARLPGRWGRSSALCNGMKSASG